MRIQTLSDVATSSVSIFAGVSKLSSGGKSLQDIVHALDDSPGYIEIYTEIAECALISNELEATLLESLPSLQYPGVYSYEVDEPFGRWWREFCLTKNRFPNTNEVRNQYLVLAKEFFSFGLSKSETEELSMVIEDIAANGHASTCQTSLKDCQVIVKDRDIFGRIEASSTNGRIHFMAFSESGQAVASLDFADPETLKLWYREQVGHEPDWEGPLNETELLTLCATRFGFTCLPSIP